MHCVVEIVNGVEIVNWVEIVNGVLTYTYNVLCHCDVDNEQVFCIHT